MLTANRMIAIMGVLAAIAVVPQSLDAQERPPSAAEVVRQFSEAARSGDTGQVNWGWSLAILTYPEKYPGPLVEGLLNGLGELALTDHDQRVRIQAALWLGTAGERIPNSGVIARLEALLEASRDDVVRAAAIDKLGLQADTAGAARVLERVATEDAVSGDDLGWPAAPYRAIRALLRLGEPGRASLERLHSSGSVRDPMARGHLAMLAARSFRTFD